MPQDRRSHSRFQGGGREQEVNLEFSYLHSSRGINKKKKSQRLGGNAGGWGGGRVGWGGGRE